MAEATNRQAMMGDGGGGRPREWRVGGMYHIQGGSLLIEGLLDVHHVGVSPEPGHLLLIHLCVIDGLLSAVQKQG